MKWIKITIMLLFLVVSFIQTASAENDLRQYLIMFNNGINGAIIEEHRGTIIEELPSINSVSALISKDNVIQLAKNNEIKYIEEDKTVSVQAYWSDWGTELIEADYAWENGLTGAGVKVAVIDTGIALHPDLKITKGIAFTSYTDSFIDDHGHGTHVAGIIAAGKNPLGLRGIAPDVELYAIKVLDHEGNGYHSNVIKAIEWAIQHEIDIINLSVGGTEGSPFLEQALKNANENHDILIVAAAGNSGYEDGVGNTVEYPAIYPSVIAVAATDLNDRRASFSAHGTSVELSAPGVNIHSTYLNGTYERLHGTSMAAPHVTAMLALLKQAYPSKTAEELRTLIQDYTIDLGVQGKDDLYGFGRVQFPIQIKVETLRPLPPENVQLVIADEKDETAQVTLMWDHQSETIFHIYRNSQKVAVVENQFLYTEQLPVGQYTYEITAVNKGGLESDKTTPLLYEFGKQVNFNETASLYSDVNKGNWFLAALHELQQKNLIGGYPDGTFKPYQAVTRAELAAMLGRTLKLNGAKRETVFPDVHLNLFASGYIQSAKEIGLISGYPDGTFRPYQPVTREEMAVFLTRSFQLNKVANSPFPDVDPNHYSYLAIQKVAGESLTVGFPDGTFRPKRAVTRAELVQFLVRALNK